jgi:hypothetical protein
MVSQDENVAHPLMHADEKTYSSPVAPVESDEPVMTGMTGMTSADRHQPQENIGATFAGGVAEEIARVEIYENGYHFPPRYLWHETLRQWGIDLWAFYNTGFGFFLVIYSLNIVAWGGMLFLLLCNAAPVMCQPMNDCDHIDSPRRIWIETDSQILNALFCVTGFGLAPWRIRDLVLLLQYRIGGNMKALRELAGVHRSWFRLEGSDRLPPYVGPKNIEETVSRFQLEAIPHPVETISSPPPTGVRASPTAMWKLDFVVWFNILNTILQIVLSAFMWGLNRYDRPSWSTGLFVCLACLAAAAAGAMTGSEGKRVKAVEGVPLTKRDMERLSRDKELGIPHWNNISDKDPMAKANKKAKRASNETKSR